MIMHLLTQRNQILTEFVEHMMTPEFLKQNPVKEIEYRLYLSDLDMCDFSLSF